MVEAVLEFGVVLDGELNGWLDSPYDCYVQWSEASVVPVVGITVIGE
jgi:hypothetical protein